MITVRYSSIDGFSEKRKFKTLAGAQAYAQKWVGKNPEMGSTYAVSGDGIGKITATVALRSLFESDEPTDEEIDAANDAAFEKEMSEQAEAERLWIIAEAEKMARESRPSRAAGCTCSDQQLTLVGCDCAACR